MKLANVLLATLVVVAGYLAISVAVQAATTTSYTVCVNKTTGAMRQIAISKTCTSLENRIVLGAVGPTGPRGSIGPAGADGVPGTTLTPSSFYSVTGADLTDVDGYNPLTQTVACDSGDVAISGSIKKVITVISNRSQGSSGSHRSSSTAFEFFANYALELQGEVVCLDLGAVHAQ